MENEPRTRRDVVRHLNRKFAIVAIGNKVRVVEESRDPILKRATFRFYTETDFRLLLKNKVIEVSRTDGDGTEIIGWADVWLISDDRRQYKGIVFDPARKRDGYLNMWQSFPHRPVEGDIDMFLNFVRDVICDGDENLYQYTMSYFAHMVQKPGELPGTALVLLGRQGVGKGFFMGVMGRLLPDHYLQLSQRRHLTGNFNGHLATALLVFADEGSFTTPHAASVLKVKVTEPTAILEHKGIDPVPMANFSRVVIASNDAHVIRAEFDERRYVIYEVSDERQNDYAFFAELNRQMDGRGLAALMHVLVNWDLSGVNLRDIPKTEALRQQKMLSMSEMQKWWFEALKAGELPAGSKKWPRAVSCSRVLRDYQNFCDEAHAKNRATQSLLGKFLRKAVPGIAKTRPGGEWTYAFPSLEECRRGFEAMIGTKIDWDD